MVRIFKYAVSSRIDAQPVHLTRASIAVAAKRRAIGASKCGAVRRPQVLCQLSYARNVGKT